MNMIEVLEQKRDGGELSTDEIDWFVRTYTAGDIKDYQASALMMAICTRGMNRRETVDLTLAMARSGEQLDLHDVVPFVVDKHSSGGVGDKTTLVVLPVVAACGVAVGKMSGRGLGPSGGTLDKMESFPGWSPNLTLAQFKSQLKEIGLVLAGQTAELAPADGKIYALRDVTGTVANVSLIAASIMSKKLAAGADAIVLDVKTGKGAFVTTVEEALGLAQIMVDIGTDAGRKTVALIADMNQPLGHAVGNALEVREAIDTLNGNGPAEFWAHCIEVAGHMLLLAGKSDTLEGAKRLAAAARDNGRALAKFRELVAAQGGDPGLVDEPARLPQSKMAIRVHAQGDGFVASVDARVIGWSSVRLGAGRQVKGEKINHAVGMVIPVKVGDEVSSGDLIGTVYGDDPDQVERARKELHEAVVLSEQPVEPLPLFYSTVM
jgi:pyrimidine-nucleoside phosphorylase